jgi:alpha-mannosidase
MTWLRGESMTTDLKSLFEIHGQRARHLCERIMAQLSFAEGLLALEPAPLPAWRVAIDAARRAVERALRDDRPLGPVVEEAEKALAPLAKAAKAVTVHCIGHAHIDMNWQWSWPETVATTLDTFATVLRLLEEYPDFRFSQSQVAVYEIVARQDPAMLAAIAARVREKRWEVTASHWVEGDKNLASGESLVRQVLLARERMRERFGLKPEDVPVDWAPDTFGHAATVPNYLRAAGIRFCYLHRPGVHTAKHEAFRWRGTNGAEILVYNGMDLGYNGRVTPAFASNCLAFVKATGCAHFPFVYGIGDHGGGPTRRDVEMIREMNAWPVFPTLRFSTAKAFFESLESSASRLPIVEGELNTEFAGCYTTQSLVKRVNRIAENRLLDAEFASALAAAAGVDYPGERLADCWREALFTQFHDILPGSGVHDTRTYTHGAYQRIMADLGVLETRALRAVAARIDTAALAARPGPAPEPASTLRSRLGGGAGVGTGDGNLSSAERHHCRGDWPFVLFNSTQAERREVAEVTLWDDAPPVAPGPLHDLKFEAVDPSGAVVAAQKTEHGNAWGHPFVKLAFPVSLPPCGYAVYVVREATGAAGNGQPPAVRHLTAPHHCPYSRVEREHYGMENEHLRIELDPQTGGILQLTSLETGTEWIDPAKPNSLLRYGIERPHGFSSWLVDHTGGWRGGEVRQVRTSQRGPHRCTIEVDLAIAESEFTVRYTLDAGAPHVEVDCTGTWVQRGTHATGIPILRLELPLALAAARARYEIPFGAVTRPYNRGEEMPALQWVAVAGNVGAGRGGVLLANDCKYGFGLEGATLHATLIHAAYDPDPLPEIGRHRMSFRIRPFVGELPDTEAISVARALNHPPRIVGAGVWKGSLPLSASGLAINSDGVVLGGMKHSEDGRGLILRFYETSGREARAKVRLDPALFGKFVVAAPVDLLERPAGKKGIALKSNAFSIAVPANGIVSVRLDRKQGDS